MHTLQNPYDAVAYPGLAFPHTHPDRLAAMAILHGLTPPAVEHCRVLEVACNEGANLIPMAYAIPGAEFVGFDLAGQSIERGQDRIRELGLHNIRIFQSDLLDVGAELGRFDYIIANGLYAWVPEPVRDRLLALCGELLTPNGIAFVSYNALPGCYLRTMIREMMLTKVGDIEDPAERVSGALQFLRFLSGTRPEGDAFRMLLEEQLERMEKREPPVTYHDELGDCYHPVHFVEFVKQAQKYGLQYLSEAELPPPPDPCYRADLRSVLESEAPGEILKQEQMLDFVRMRMYRETLLCRQDRVLRRDFPAEHFRRLFLASQVTSKLDEETGKMVFTLPGGIKMETNHPGAIALLKELEAAWPRARSVAEIEPRLAEAGLPLDEDGATLLMRLAVAKMIELHGWQAPVAECIAERPRASVISREEAQTRSKATTLLHSTISLDDPLVRSFLKLLDGTRDRGQLLDALRVELPSNPADEIARGIEPCLRSFHRAGVLEA